MSELEISLEQPPLQLAGVMCRYARDSHCWFTSPGLQAGDGDTATAAWVLHDSNQMHHNTSTTNEPSARGARHMPEVEWAGMSFVDVQRKCSGVSPPPSPSTRCLGFWHIVYDVVTSTTTTTTTTTTKTTSPGHMVYGLRHNTRNRSLSNARKNIGHLQTAPLHLCRILIQVWPLNALCLRHARDAPLCTLPRPASIPATPHQDHSHRHRLV